MTARDDLDRRIAAWFAADTPAREPEHLLGQVLARTARTRRRPAWRIPERWIPMSALTTRTAAAPRMPWRLVGVAALLILAALAAGAVLIGNQPRKVPAPFGPASNGLVAYSAGGDIYTVDPVTGAARALVTGPSVDENPVFSRDGTRFAFRRTIEGESDGRLYVARANGDEPIEITPEPLPAIDSVSFSPDGREVLFAFGRSSRQIAIAQADGSGTRTLDLRMWAEDPAFRPPDGARIAFTGSPSGTALVTGLYVVNADGSGLRTLVEAARDAAAGDPQWSPDGSRLAYSLVDFSVQEWTVQTHVMTADGGGDRALPSPTGAKWNYSGGWSNDGTRLAVKRGYSLYGEEDTVVAVVPVDGSGTGVETSHFSGAGAFEWAPDDTSMLFLLGGNPDTNTAAGALTPMIIDPVTGKSRSATWAPSSPATWQRVAP